MPKILSLIRLKSAERDAICAIDPTVEVVTADGWFEAEYADTWPATTVARYVGAAGRGTRAERDALLADAEVVIIGFPFPLDLRRRAPQLRWVHQTPAGASNLRRGDLWCSDVTVTTSRGYGETTAIAEYAVAGLLHFAKDFDRAIRDHEHGAFDYRRYAPRGLQGKTLCVVGAGGIGREIARLAQALGMRVVGTYSGMGERASDPLFEVLERPEGLHGLLSSSDFVAVSCQWTEATTNLLDERAFAAMKPGSVLVNVARGEILDEDAMLAALDSGHLRGAALDVFIGEFEREPPPSLWHHPQILISPHTSALTDSSTRRALELFATNLRAFLQGAQLHNAIDWEQGY